MKQYKKAVMHKLRSCRLLWLMQACLLAFPVGAAQCLYVSSYHAEYEWDQGIRRGMEPLLSGHCELSRFFMDTKRNTQPAFARAQALKALELIRSTKPDVVIAADDNASRYLVAPHLRNGDTPVVFCGINTSAEPYQYPYSNATGMVEVTPYQPLLLALRGVLKTNPKGIFLAADVRSQHRMYNQLAQQFSEDGIEFSGRFVKTQGEWENAWSMPEPVNFIFVGNPAGIANWNYQRALDFVERHTDAFTLTAWDWMAPLAMITVTKEPEEQGEWAAKVAIEIIEKEVSPATIPVVINRRWRMLANPALLSRGDFRLPLSMQHIVENLHQ